MALFVYMTAPDMAVAKNISMALVEKKLVACVNILPQMQSIYWWQGKIEQAQEVVVIAKTTKQCFEKLQEFVLSMHTYECPCIVALPIENGNKDFLAWIKNSLE